MGILDSVFKIFIGDKSKKDIKEIQPLVDSILVAEKKLQQLSLDELRAKTNAFKNKIKDARSEVENSITSLKEEADANRRY